MVAGHPHWADGDRERGGDMDSIALITGADRGLGFGLAGALLERGWTVYAGQYMPDWPELAELAAKWPERLWLVSLDVGMGESVREAAERVAQSADHIDLLVNNAAVLSLATLGNIRTSQDFDDALAAYNVNALGAMRVVKAFLPLTDRGALRRLGFVSSEAGSIAIGRRSGWFGYSMSKAALNRGVAMLFTHLRPEGYTFRLYHPGWVRSYMYGQKNPKGNLEPEEAGELAARFFLDSLPDENRLALIDYQGREVPW